MLPQNIPGYCEVNYIGPRYSGLSISPKNHEHEDCTYEKLYLHMNMVSEFKNNFVAIIRYVGCKSE
jgi:hypothetical protein